MAGLAGCDELAKPRPELVYLPDQRQPPPLADLPLAERVENWIGTNDRGDRGGSCMWASLWNCIRGANRPDLEKLLEAKRDAGFEGPEHLASMARKLDSIGIPFAATDDGDVSLLDAASIAMRWAVIGYYRAHAVNFCGFATLDRAGLNALRRYTARNSLGLRGDRLGYLMGADVAILLDNNDPRSYIVVEPRERFVRSWQRAYYGMAIVPWLDRFVPPTYPRTRTKRG